MSIPPPSDWTIFVPLISSLVGAGVGAFTAQWIAARNKSHDDLLREIRSANSACAMAYSITDSFITVKKDIVKPLADTFAQQRSNAEIARKNFIPGVSGPIGVSMDLQTFNMLRTPISHLQDIVFKNISAPVRAVNVVAVLDRTILEIETFHKERNGLCDEFRERGVNPDQYFGFATDKGADQRYSSVLHNLTQYTDDAIYFSRLLGDDLRTYANGLKALLPYKQKARAPVITSADFSKEAAMLPDPAKYKDYETMFVRIPSSSPKWKFWRREKTH
jgi:hypothetical protein